MPNTSKIISRFLTELHSNEVQEAFESLNTLLEHLENKPDPEPIELRIVELTYQTIEKLKFLEALLRRHTGENSPLMGSRLQELYDKASEINPSSLID